MNPKPSTIRSLEAGPKLGRSRPDRCQSTAWSLQTPTRTIDRDFGAFMEASKHRQARWIVASDPAEHRHGRCNVHWGASRASLEASGTLTWPMGHEIRHPNCFQETPKIDSEAPGNIKKRSYNRCGARVLHAKNPEICRGTSAHVIIRCRAAECAKRVVL